MARSTSGMRISTSWLGWMRRHTSKIAQPELVNLCQSIWMLPVILYNVDVV